MDINTLIELFNVIAQIPAESLIALVVLCSMGFSCFVIKTVVNALSGKGGSDA